MTTRLYSLITGSGVTTAQVDPAAGVAVVDPDPPTNAVIDSTAASTIVTSGGGTAHIQWFD